MYYCFKCDDCQHGFDVKSSMKKISGLKPTCPKCSSKNTYRDYSSERKHVGDSSPKTLGTLAERNNDKLSVDERISIHRKNTEHLRNRPDACPLPEGCEPLQKAAESETLPKGKSKRKK